MRIFYKAPRFDEHQFTARPQVVTARYMGLDRWDSTDISFEDYGRMGRESHKLFLNREINAPSFALNVPEMKLLLARYFECRAGWFRTPKVGTPEWRLKIALRKIQKDSPNKRERLRDLNYEYVMLTRQGADPKQLQKLEKVIRALDGEILMAQRGVAPVVALIYFHFRLGYSSPQTAAELDLRPQSVRQIAFRLTKLWEQMQSGEGWQPSKREIANPCPPEELPPERREAFIKYQREYKARSAGIRMIAIGN